MSLDQSLGRSVRTWDVKVDVNDVLRRGRVSDRSVGGESRPLGIGTLKGGDVSVSVSPRMTRHRKI